MLHVRGPWMTCQITVLDHASALVASGVGELQVSLPAGLYQVLCRLGDATEKKLVDVAPGSATPLRFEYGALTFRSAAPISGTSTTREWHEGPAARHSRDLTDRSRSGNSRLFIFVRTVQPERYQDFARGLRLRDRARRVVTTFETGVAKDQSGGYLAYSADLPAGPYVLTFARRGRPARSQPLWLSPGYETQAFVPVRKVPILGDLSLFMAPLGQGFDPGDPMVKTTETVLDGLERGINLASSNEMQQMLIGKFQHPWLGVLAAHALRRDPSPDLSLIRTVVSNMADLIPDHPDVRALLLEYGADDHEPFDTPPMLWAGLDIVQRHAREHLETIPPHSPLARIYPRLLQDSPWVAWQRERQAVKRAQSASKRRRADEESRGLPPAAPSIQMPVVAEGLARKAYELDYDALPTAGLSESEEEEASGAEPFALEGTLFARVDAAEVSQALQIPLSTASVALEALLADPAGKLADPSVLNSAEQAVLEYSLQRGGSGGAAAATTLPSESEVERLYKRLSAAAGRLQSLGQGKTWGASPPDQSVALLYRVAAAVGQQDDAVLVVDEAAVVHYVSATIEAITGFAPDTIVRGSQRGYAPLVAALEASGVGDDVRLPHADGSEITVRVARADVAPPAGSSERARLYKLRLAGSDPIPEERLRELQSGASTVELYLSLMTHAGADERADQHAKLHERLERMAERMDVG